MTAEGATAIFKPARKLKPNTEHTATITTKAKDLAGNAMAVTKEWSFTTGAELDTTAPTVSSVIPANGATGQPVHRKPTAAFSEFINPLTLTTATFTLKQGTTPVSGAVIYDGVKATFKPAKNSKTTPHILPRLIPGPRTLQAMHWQMIKCGALQLVQRKRQVHRQ